jgi:hypothetical protein
MSKQQEYLLNSDQCCEIAGMSGNGKHREALLAMAKTWQMLAAEEERIADLVKAVDELFPPLANQPHPHGIRPPNGLVHRLEETRVGKTLRKKFGKVSSRPTAQCSAADMEAMHFPRWLSKRLVTVQESLK